ncbi:SNF2 family N-terminal domain-containing protein, partial [Xylariales sp. AK1849]
HQKQALTFMRNREAGWNLTGDRTDVWSLKENPNGGIGYLNNMDNSLQYQQPPSFRGGILADNMGSGKSLSMIALIAHDRIRRTIGKDDIPLMKHKPCDNKTTLLVMRSSLLQNWQHELNTHLAPKDFKWRCHHGHSKTTDIRDLEMLDIVLVTYHTVSSEWRMSRNASILFTSRWNRIIIDEDWSISSQLSICRRTVCDIQSSSQWAVTGTPIQNNLSDLQSLLKFLRVYPYDDKDTFYNHFTNLWTNGKGVLATNRLRQPLGYIMLRRSGGHIVLPDREDLKMHLSFSGREMETYSAAKEKALEFIDDVMSSHNATRGYKNAVEKTNHLRLICNHGFWQPDDGCAERKLEVEGDNTEQWSSTAAHKALDRFPSLGLPIACVECSNLVDDNMTICESQLLEPMSSIQIHLTRCLRLWCTACYSSREILPKSLAFCSCDTECPVATARLDSLSRSPSPFVANENGHFEQRTYPTKIRALLDNVQNLPKSTKSIVFSFWKSTLDIARTALNEAGIACVQIDGKVKPKNRKTIFEKFQTDETTRILLLSLSCGAVGLTLTAASRVYLMEPQWNPSLEEQALARVYRIGQKQDVTTIRFLMKDSIEKYVTDIQDKKKDLISILLSSRSQVSHHRLHELRDWLK